MGGALTNIFVLMLENHSFDHLFARSGIPGIRVATVQDFNSWTPSGSSARETYFVKDGAPSFMDTDPGHEFADVLQQLCGAGTISLGAGGAYPAINNSGFVSSYGTSHSEQTGLPTSDHVGDIMACFHTETQLPVIHRLATEFAICDNWFSPVPGPTWPNRCFVHGASSAGWTDSPALGDEIEWLATPELGFRYEKGSIFQALTHAKHGWRLYQDKENRFAEIPSGPEYGGWISQIATLKGISLLDMHSLDSFASDLGQMEKGTDNKERPAYLKYPYTFIEPNFGKSFFARQEPDEGGPWYDGPTYKGGSSQHPEDDPSGGEGLIKAIYEAIRHSPIWNTSLLVIVYDEHGGFYDSVPPAEAVAPGDKTPFLQKKSNALGFDFKRYGVRVPAVIVSPLIPKGTVDHTLYDHTSILATIERMLGMSSLTERDKAANDLRHLLALAEPREDCPLTLPAPAPIPEQHKLAAAAQEGARVAEDALPLSGNVVGFLHVLLKAEIEMSDVTLAERQKMVNRFRQINTKSAAREYIKAMWEMVEKQEKKVGSMTA